MPAGVLNRTGVATLALPSVTLVAVTSVALSATMRALIESLSLLRFGQALWISDQPKPLGSPAGVVWPAWP